MKRLSLRHRAYEYLHTCINGEISLNPSYYFTNNCYSLSFAIASHNVADNTAFVDVNVFGCTFSGVA